MNKCLYRMGFYYGMDIYILRRIRYIYFQCFRPALIKPFKPFRVYGKAVLIIIIIVVA